MNPPVRCYCSTDCENHLVHVSPRFWQQTKINNSAERDGIHLADELIKTPLTGFAKPYVLALNLLASLRKLIKVNIVGGIVTNNEG